MLSRFYAKLTNILAARCTNNSYICTWLDLKRDNRHRNYFIRCTRTAEFSCAT